MAVNWLEKDELLSTGIAQINPTDVLLDIGCGIMPQRFTVPSVHICVEPFTQYVEKLQEKVKDETDRSYVILNATWAEALKILPPKSVDTVIMIDVIEHIDKAEAKKLLKDTEKLARRQIVIFTPLGFLPQEHPDGKDAWGLDGGKWQEHKSGWEPDDFGDDWEIFAAKEFHMADNLGRGHETPFGALWAIKTFPKPQSSEAFWARVQAHRVGQLNLSLPRFILRPVFVWLMDAVVVCKKAILWLTRPITRRLRKV